MKTVAIAFVILSLASVGFCTNWEYQGNWTADNTTAINAAIGVAMQASTSSEVADTTGYNLGTFAKKLSENLETVQNWAQFWNVFVIVQSVDSDSVVYGYAFRNHWLWKNNVQFTGFTPALSPPFIQPTGKNISLIIWKDYNCQERIYSTTPITDCTFGQTIKTAINSAVQNDKRPRVTEDIWTTAYNIVQAIENPKDAAGQTIVTDVGGDNRAYSAVLSQDKAAVFYGAFCESIGTVGSDELGHSFDGNQAFGSIFLFQTRDYANAAGPGR